MLAFPLRGAGFRGKPLELATTAPTEPTGETGVSEADG